MMRKEYNIVFKEKQLDEGLTKSEIMDMFDMLSGVEAIPIEIQGEHSTAMGFINLTDARWLNYDYGELSPLHELVKSVLDDMGKEKESMEYEIANTVGVSTIFLSR